MRAVQRVTYALLSCIRSHGEGGIVSGRHLQDVVSCTKLQRDVPRRVRVQRPRREHP